MNWIMPVESGRITSFFGARTAPTLGASSNHKGIDIAVPVGTPVMAALDGIVTTSSYSSASGNYIIIDHGSGIETVYKHLSESMLPMSRKVTKGQVIGLSGNTGLSTGPHLHFEILQDGVHVDPLNFSLGKFSGSSPEMGDIFDSVATEGLNVLKKYWYVAAGAMVVLAIVRK